MSSDESDLCLVIEGSEKLSDSEEEMKPKQKIGKIIAAPKTSSLNFTSKTKKGVRPYYQDDPIKEDKDTSLKHKKAQVKNIKSPPKVKPPSSEIADIVALKRQFDMNTKVIVNKTAKIENEKKDKQIENLRSEIKAKDKLINKLMLENKEIPGLKREIQHLESHIESLKQINNNAAKSTQARKPPLRSRLGRGGVKSRIGESSDTRQTMNQVMCDDLEDGDDPEEHGGEVDDHCVRAADQAGETVQEQNRLRFIRKSGGGGDGGLSLLTRKKGGSKERSGVLVRKGSTFSKIEFPSSDDEEGEKNGEEGDRHRPLPPDLVLTELTDNGPVPASAKRRKIFF